MFAYQYLLSSSTPLVLETEDNRSSQNYNIRCAIRPAARKFVQGPAFRASEWSRNPPIITDPTLSLFFIVDSDSLKNC